jgi:hypothetical protein
MLMLEKDMMTRLSIFSAHLFSFLSCLFSLCDAQSFDGMAAFQASAFESFEKDFNEVLAQLVGDTSLERFRQEYEKLYRALQKSHESEKRLIRRCHELNAEIVGNTAKVKTALQLSQKDSETITALRKVSHLMLPIFVHSIISRTLGS